MQSLRRLDARIALARPTPERCGPQLERQPSSTLDLAGPHGANSVKLAAPSDGEDHHGSWTTDVDGHAESVRAFDVDALAELCAGFNWALQRGNPLAHLVKPSHAKLGVQLEMARVLIAGGCDVDLGQDRGEPPLWSAVRHNNVGLVEVLLSAGADADTACEFPCRALWSPLHTAAADGRAEVAALLVKAGATERPDFAGVPPVQVKREHGTLRFELSPHLNLSGENHEDYIGGHRWEVSS